MKTRQEFLHGSEYVEFGWSLWGPDLMPEWDLPWAIGKPPLKGLDPCGLALGNSEGLDFVLQLHSGKEPTVPWQSFQT